MKNEQIKALQDFIREPYAWPGGYAKMLVMQGGDPLCHDCAKDNYRLISDSTRNSTGNAGWAVWGVEIYWEGPSVNCSHCGCELESEYGDPDA